MNILKKLFIFNKKSDKNKEFSSGFVDQYIEIAKLVKEARIKQNLTIKELSYISKIPERIINSIENNNTNIRPEYPFIRSILIKLEECLLFKENTLLKLAVRERKVLKKGGKEFLFRKIDIINTWQGSILYFFILVLSIFILKRYFILNVKVIEIQNIENQIMDNQIIDN
jgi:cytoskeletal protein RodZ